MFWYPWRLQKQASEERFCGTQLETMKSCDFLFLAFLRHLAVYNNYPFHEPIRNFVFHWCSSVSDWTECNQGHYILVPRAQDLSGQRQGSIPGAWCWPKGARPLRTRMKALVPLSLSLYRMVFVSICEHASIVLIVASTSSCQIFLASTEHFKKYRWRSASSLQNTLRWWAASTSSTW